MNYRDRLKELIKEVSDDYYSVELLTVSNDELLSKHGKDKQTYLFGLLTGLEIAKNLLEEQNELQN